MSSFQIGVISTSIVLGPHINLLLGKITDHSVTNNKNETHFLPIQKYLVHIHFLIWGINVSLPSDIPLILLKITGEGGGTPRYQNNKYNHTASIKLDSF